MNIRMILGIGLLVVVVFGIWGCNRVQGSGNIETEARDVSDFTAVEFSGVGEMTIIQGDTEGITIESNDNLLPYITTEVRNGTLAIGVKDTWWFSFLRPSHTLRYTLNVKSLNSFEMSGAGIINAAHLTTDDFALTTSGAGNVTFEQLTVDNLNVTMSGAGNVTVDGRATNQTVKMSGLGNYQAGDLESQNASLTLSGAGNATVWVNETLDTSLAGAGTVSYYGTPQMSTSTSGIGDVKSLGTK